MFKDRREVLANAIDLSAAVELDVLWRDLSIERQIPCSSRRGDAKAVRQIRAANFAHKVKAKVDVGQSFSLAVTQTFRPLGMHMYHGLILS
jgi:hypothetical protein